METQRLVELGELCARQVTDSLSDPLDGDGPDLFRLGLGVRGETGGMSYY